MWDARDVNITALDTVTAVNQRGEDGNPGRLTVPAGATEISDILLVAVSNLAVAAKANALIRMSGGGLPFGPEVFALHGAGAPVATGNTYSRPVRQLSWPEGKGIPVTPGNGIDFEAEQTGEDTGEMSASIGLAFRVPEV
jgi:hypothetical protein